MRVPRRPFVPSLPAARTARTALLQEGDCEADVRRDDGKLFRLQVLSRVRWDHRLVLLLFDEGDGLRSFPECVQGAGRVDVQASVGMIKGALRNRIGSVILGFFYLD